MTKRRTKMIAGLSVAAALTGGSLAVAALPAMAETIASTDATTPPTPSSEDDATTGEHGHGPRGEELTGDVAAEVEAAVLAEYPDATIERLETDPDGAYEAHLTQADGTRVTVELDEAFAITDTRTGGPGHGPRGEELTGDVAAQVEAAVLAEYPDATIERLETDPDGVYEAHLTQADGTRVTVELDEALAIIDTRTGGPGHGRGGRPDRDAATPETEDSSDSDAGGSAASGS
ncbi:hypothetical protein [Planctomonas deserti]|uniref:hypothetical protein n=1 Tax=Planctomonas deserti TaxID=2144185 RepID=UPI00197C297A|nr:hypothetical protein [Planctomonas deserti]